MDSPLSSALAAMTEQRKGHYSIAGVLWRRALAVKRAGKHYTLQCEHRREEPAANASPKSQVTKP